jgi:hypothetical protein
VSAASQIETFDNSRLLAFWGVMKSARGLAQSKTLRALYARNQSR